MPQMMPIWWVLIVLLSFSSLFYIFVSMFYLFMKLNSSGLNNSSSIFKKTLMIDDL